MKDKLLVERDLAASWFVDGGLRLALRGGYHACSSAEHALKEWREYSDSVMAFVAFTCDMDSRENPVEFTPLAELYSSYSNWSTRSGRQKLAQATLGSRLTTIGIPKRRVATGSEYRLRVRPMEQWTFGD